jgi:putative flippase GtrA
MLFALVTLSGVMLVQNTVYITFIFLLHGHMQFFVHLAHAAHLKLTDTFFDINVSNLIGSLCAMVWNYNGYRLVVFTKPLPQPEIDHETA